MNKLTIDTFLYAADIELCQYKVLDSLKQYSQEFHRNRLYPGLSEISELNLAIKEIDDDESVLEDLFVERFNKSVSSYDGILVEEVKMSEEQQHRAMELIEWAKPLVQDLVNEGKVIYEFVKKNIRIEEIGIVSNQKDEGYILFPDNREEIFQLHRYEVRMLNEGRKTQRKLSTKYLQSIERLSLDTTPEAALLSLFEQYADMPNSATFMCTTDLDFPFFETILPVAKRKLMARMAA